jgi:hypothetical protein
VPHPTCPPGQSWRSRRGGGASQERRWRAQPHALRGQRRLCRARSMHPSQRQRTALRGGRLFGPRFAVHASTPTRSLMNETAIVPRDMRAAWQTATAVAGPPLVAWHECLVDVNDRVLEAVPLWAGITVPRRQPSVVRREPSGRVSSDSTCVKTSSRTRCTAKTCAGYESPRLLRRFAQEREDEPAINERLLFASGDGGQGRSSRRTVLCQVPAAFETAAAHIAFERCSPRGCR